MKLILRILLFIHLALILFGIYCAVFEEEYIRSSKYVFIGFTGVLVFLNTLLLFPIKVKFQNILLGLGLVLYAVSASGFIIPTIFKNYWGILFGLAIFLFLMSLFAYSGKTLFVSKFDYLFLLGSILVALPFLLEVNQNGIIVFSSIILLILTIIIFARIFRHQSK